MTQHSRRHKQPEPQAPQGHFLLPAQVPLEQHDQVVGQARQAQCRLARPELFQAQGWQRKARLKFLDHVFAVGPAVVVTPRAQRGVRRPGQARHQDLKAIARHVQQFLAAALLVIAHAMAQQHQPARVRPALRPILHLGHFGPRHFGRRPLQIAFDELLDRLAQFRHHHVGQLQLFPQRQQFGQAEARISTHTFEPDVAGQVLPQVQKERGRVAAATGVAGSQPQLRHEPHFGQHRQQRMQAGLDALLGVAAFDAFLLAVLVQEPRGIQIQRVAVLLAGQPIHAPMPERTEAAQVVARRGEPLEETRQHRLTGHARDAQEFRHERIAAQIGDVGELACVTQQPVHEGQRLFEWQQFVVGQRQRMRQRGGKIFARIQRLEPTPEQRTPCVR